ncbi:MAG: c-type cytochrome [Bacteroidales bacterium]
MKTRNQIFLAVTMLLTIAFFSNNAMAQKKPGPWETPAKFKTMKNPVKATDAEASATGKTLYAKHCKSCHGAQGLGDGPKGSTLKTLTGDFSSKDFQAFSDGELFYKITAGRDEMPAYDKKVPDEADRWALVNFLRTLKK